MPVGHPRSPTPWSRRARMVLASARRLGPLPSRGASASHHKSVGKWRRRFRAAGIEPACTTNSDPVGPRTYDDDNVAAVVPCRRRPIAVDALEYTHLGAAGHCQEHGTALARPLRGQAASGEDLQAVQPIRSSSRKCATSSGCTSTRPDHAMVLCVDREVADSGAQSHPADAADGPRHVEGYTHDYVRHGTTTLFAALDIATERCCRAVPEAAPPRRVPVAQPDRPGGAGGVGQPGPATTRRTSTPSSVWRRDASI